MAEPRSTLRAQRPSQQEPTCLNRERLSERCALKPPKENGDRAKQLVINAQPFHYGLDADGHDVDMETFGRLENIRTNKQ
jgi:hypothetical protein